MGFLWNNRLSFKSIQKSVKFIKFDEKSLKFVPKSEPHELRERKTDLEEKIPKVRWDCCVFGTFAGCLILTPVVIIYSMKMVVGALIIYFWTVFTCIFGIWTYLNRSRCCSCNLREHISTIKALNNLSHEESIYKAYSDMKYKKLDLKIVPKEISSLSDQKI